MERLGVASSLLGIPERPGLSSSKSSEMDGKLRSDGLGLPPGRSKQKHREETKPSIPRRSAQQLRRRLARLCSRSFSIEATSSARLGLAFPALALLVLPASATFPVVRHPHHNVFEGTDRFAGWTTLALLWALVFFFHRLLPAIFHFVLF
uniref:Uncharacterized protein n=1 Tax=Nymphaea colorata TaxID=210225 RepID=A0A5K0WCU4_9MAGN